MKLKYHLLDVFTDTPLAGNPLAVVMKADHLQDSEMQAIAAEFNLSETVFVRQPRLDHHAANLRIFTPRTELPFAGHPTVGTGVLLGLMQRLQAVRLEEQIGVITCVMERGGRRHGHAQFSLPRLPERLGDAPSAEAMASVLGIAPAEIGCGDYEAALYSAGVPFYLVPVRDADILARVHLERRGWAEIFTHGQHSAYVFTTTPEESDNDIAARMFSPGMGLSEDPATGSAAAALIGLLATKQGGGGQHHARIRQGREMGRPSLIEVTYTLDNGELKRGSIGGSAVVIAEGELDFGA